MIDRKMSWTVRNAQFEYVRVELDLDTNDVKIEDIPSGTVIHVGGTAVLSLATILAEVAGRRADR